MKFEGSNQFVRSATIWSWRGSDSGNDEDFCRKLDAELLILHHDALTWIDINASENKTRDLWRMTHLLKLKLSVDSSPAVITYTYSGLWINILWARVCSTSILAHEILNISNLNFGFLRILYIYRNFQMMCRWAKSSTSQKVIFIFRLGDFPRRLSAWSQTSTGIFFWELTADDIILVYLEMCLWCTTWQSGMDWAKFFSPSLTVPLVASCLTRKITKLLASWFDILL